LAAYLQQNVITCIFSAAPDRSDHQHGGDDRTDDGVESHIGLHIRLRLLKGPTPPLVRVRSRIQIRKIVA
jgi:hypothetical protein